MTERLIDNTETGFRELWDDRDSEPYARIQAERLATNDVCWTSEWMVARWKPEKKFGHFKEKR